MVSASQQIASVSAGGRELARVIALRPAATLVLVSALATGQIFHVVILAVVIAEAEAEAEARGGGVNAGGGEGG